jgi:adenosylcobyric acid synthase
VTALAVQGCSSSAGKSLVTTALARAFARRGVRVAPFKAQNMSNNARVVTGGEIGVAQYLQALAAGAEPDVRMNPVLVKPEGDTRSQVVVLGSPDLALSSLPWRERARFLWPSIESSLRALLDEYELVLVEGAGSPAELNLADVDAANLRAARAADARVLLVVDIDRGGAFAHLFGTWSLVPDDHRGRLRGFVLNKFRGDPSLLSPAPERLQELTGVPTLGVLPWLEHGLPDEDGAAAAPRVGGRPTVAVVRYPTASNLDEFKPLEEVADVMWASSRAEVASADLAVLPGSKHVAGDLSWLRVRGLDAALVERARRGGRVLGICGGLQMLGGAIVAEAGVDGGGVGVGLLPLRTRFRREKLARERTVAFAALPEPWSTLSGARVHGYEIRHGRSEPTAAVAEALPDGLGFVAGPVLGVYLHGLLAEPAVAEALLGVAPSRTIEETLDELADAAERHLDLDTISAIAGIA